MLRSARFRVLLSLAVAGVGFGAAAPAHAVDATDFRLNDGTVRFVLSAAASGRLSATDTTITGRTMPIRSGLWSFDRLRDGGGGTLDLGRALVVRRGRARVALSAVRLAIAQDAGSGRFESGRLSAKIGPIRYPLGTLRTRRYRTSTGRFRGVDVILSPAAVGALNGAMGVRAFRSGDRLGEFRGTGMTQRLRFTGGETTLAFSEPLREAFRTAGASIFGFDATEGDGTEGAPFRLPVRGRELDLVTGSGSFALGGAVRLLAPQGRFFGTAPFVDLDDVVLRFQRGGYDLIDPLGRALMTLRGSTAARRTSTRLTHGALQVRFTPAAAELFAPTLGLSTAQFLALPPGTAGVTATIAG